MSIPVASQVIKCPLGGTAWGPRGCSVALNETQDASSSSQSLLEILPFELNLKSSLFSQQLFKSCDFTFNVPNQRQQREGRNVQVEEDQLFHTVDNKPISRQGREGWLQRRRPPIKATTAAYNEKTKEEEELKLGKKAKSEQKKQLMQQQARYARLHARHRAFSEWSVQPTNDWTVQAELPLSQLHKQAINCKEIKVVDIEWRGQLGYYSKQADKISTKLPVPLQNLSSNFDYYWVTTQDDDVIKEHMLSSNTPVHVAATDQVLACLMAAPQSKYSWHLHLTKIDGKIIIDKANGSIVDLLTVNETSPEPPMQDAENRLNRPAALGYEAVKINQNLRQQLLVRGELSEEYPPAPFVEKDENPASMAYRYRLFTIPGRSTGSLGKINKEPINILTRTEVHAKLPPTGTRRDDALEKRDGDNFIIDGGHYVYICALNEYESKGQKSYRIQIDTQRGALLATEVRNNACKLRKFVASAMLAGCDELRLGFVSRKTNNDNEHHVVLTVQSYQTRDLGRQIGLKPENAWGIIRSIVDLLADKPDGRFVLLKDPTKPVMRLYLRPEDEEEDDAQDQANADAN